MNRASSFWRFSRAWFNRRPVQAALALRVTVAAMLSLIVAQLAQLHLPLWAVMTAVVVTQMSVGASLKATADYLIGTFGGAIYGGAIAVVMPHESAWALLLALAVAVAPLAFIAAAYPRMKVAPITAIIVLLVPAMLHTTPIASAIDRVLEVAVGGIIGFVVSFVLMPSRAHGQAVETAAHILDAMARALRGLIAGSSHGLDTAELHRLQDGIGRSLVRMSVISAEAEHERAARLASEPDTGPLTRMLLRLRHDIVMVGRAVQLPLPQALESRLHGELEAVTRTVADYLADSGTALRARRLPPPRAAADAALDAYMAQLSALRAAGATRDLSVEAIERVFTLSFAFEQIRKNLDDLQRCVSEWAEVTEGPIAS